jgi:cellobiose PTS system EIIC component
LMYYPFFKLYEKSVEQQNNKVDDKYADLDLDF